MVVSQPNITPYLVITLNEFISPLLSLCAKIEPPEFMWADATEKGEKISSSIELENRRRNCIQVANYQAERAYYITHI